MTDRHRAEAARNHDINDDDCPMSNVTRQIIADAKAALSKVGVPEVEVYYLSGRLSAAIEIENGLKTPSKAASYLSSHHPTTCTCDACRIARQSGDNLSHILRLSAAVNTPVQQEECGNEDAHNSRREDADN